MNELWERALALAKGQSPSASAIQRVASATSSEASAWAFAQWDLRTRARSKFALAEQMLFAREALEQATHEKVAAYHASLFPPEALVADLTTGIGADLIALASRGPAVGFELDEFRADFARHNLRVHGLDAIVQTTDCLTANWDFDFAFADPSRRVESRRTLDPSEFSPDPTVVATRFGELKLGVMKLSPLLSDPFLTQLGPRLEFLSYGGECREAVVIAGSDATAGRVAVHVESGSILESCLPPPQVELPRRFLYDADPAAVRAHAIGTLCELFGLSPLGDSNGYLTGDDLIRSPWLRPYEVQYHGKSDVKSTRKALRDVGGTVFEIKQRGVKADVEKLKKELGFEGKLLLSLVLWPIGSSLRHTLVSAAPIHD